jgi:hypothetical protein
MLDRLGRSTQPLVLAEILPRRCHSPGDELPTARPRTYFVSVAVQIGDLL